MAKEYKTFVYKDNEEGRRQMAHDIDNLSNMGWEVKSKESSAQGWAFGKTFCLGCLFLPLALLGKKNNIIQVIMERDRDVVNQNTTTPSFPVLPK